MPGGSVNLGHVVGPVGPQGATGPTGPQGVQGPVGPGVPAGGNANEVLRKASGTNYDTEWHKLTGEDIPVSASDASSLSQQIDDLGPYNGLDSDSTIAALSAAQGKALSQVTTGTIQTSLLQLQGESFLKKKNGIVELELAFRPLENITAWTVIATIPEGFRPPKAIFSMDLYPQSGTAIYQINTDGTIQPSFAMNATDQHRSIPIMWML